MLLYSVISEHFGMKDIVVTRIEKGMVRWFGFIERMDVSKIDGTNF